MGNKNYSRCAIHTWSIYNVEYFIMSHQGNTELEESKEEDRPVKIVSWKLVAYDENDNEIIVDVHRNHVANLIDDFLTEEFEENK